MKKASASTSILLVFFILVTLALLTGCGGKNSGSDDASQAAGIGSEAGNPGAGNNEDATAAGAGNVKDNTSPSPEPPPSASLPVSPNESIPGSTLTESQQSAPYSDPSDKPGSDGQPAEGAAEAGTAEVQQVPDPDGSQEAPAAGASPESAASPTPGDLSGQQAESASPEVPGTQPGSTPENQPDSAQPGPSQTEPPQTDPPSASPSTTPSPSDTSPAQEPIVGLWKPVDIAWTGTEQENETASMLADSLCIFSADGSFRLILPKSFLDMLQGSADSDTIFSVTNGSWEVVGVGADGNTIYSLSMPAFSSFGYGGANMQIIDGFIIFEGFDQIRLARLE